MCGGNREGGEAAPYAECGPPAADLRTLGICSADLWPRTPSSTGSSSETRPGNLGYIHGTAGSMTGGRCRDATVGGMRGAVCIVVREAPSGEDERANLEAD
jgi:hypothetical protein